MAQPASTFSTYDAVGIREDLADMIYDVSPTETPFLTMVSKNKATNTYHEWQTDSLAAASGTNAVIEGDDATTDASTATTRLGNYTQISDKVARVTGTQEAVKKAGRKREMAYQMLKRGKELKRDMETSLLQNNARVAGNDTTARELAGVLSWLTTNEDRGSGATSPTGDGTDAAGNGTQRAFSEALLKTVHQATWVSGGNPDVLIVGAFNKAAASGFTGIATATKDVENKKIIATADVYVGDFGEFNIIADRYCSARDAYLLEKSYWCVSFLRNMVTNDLAKTGDTERKQILVEYTLEAKNEASSGVIADLTTS